MIHMIQELFGQTLRDGPEWRLEVADEADTIRHLFRLTAETFDP